MSRSRLGLLALPFVLAACWSRFGDLTDEAPVLMVDRPANVPAFGQSMVAFDEGSLLVQRPDGQSQYALFPFGQSVDPNKAGVAVSAILTSPSGGSGPDLSDPDLNTALGTVVSIDDFGGKFCVIGTLTRTSNDQNASYNLLALCLNDLTRGNQQNFPNVTAFPLPSQFDAAGFATFASSSLRLYPGELSLASAPGYLVAGAPDAGLAWVHPVPTDTAQSTAAIALLPAPADGDSTYGWAVAALGTGQATDPIVVAVPDPTVGSVFLTKVAPDGTTTPAGCVSGGGGYGTVLHAFADKGRHLLAVGDADRKVDVIDLDQVPASVGCTPPTSALVASIACVEGADATGCDGGRFGFSLAHGDLDGDGDQELLVGAPGMNVRDRGNAGAVYVYDLEAQPNDATETLFLSYPDGPDLLGKTVGALHEGDHDVVVATAEGRSQLAIFYCTALGGKGASSSRCAAH